MPKGLASDVREDLAAAIYRDFRAALAAQFDAEGDLAMPEALPTFRELKDRELGWS